METWELGIVCEKPCTSTRPRHLLIRGLASSKASIKIYKQHVGGVQALSLFRITVLFPSSFLIKNNTSCVFISIRY